MSLPSCETWESFPSYPVLNGSFASVFYSFENCWAACGVPSSVYTEDPDVEVKSNLWGSPGPYWQLWAGEMATQGLQTGQSLTGFQNVSNGTREVEISRFCLGTFRTGASDLNSTI